MSAGRLSERTDLRPVAMCARDVRPGMVLVLNDARRTVTVDRLDVPAEYVQILGEDVLGHEIAPGDVVRTHGAWHTQLGAWTGAAHQPAIRAYIDPEWDRAQAEDGRLTLAQAYADLDATVLFLHRHALAYSRDEDYADHFAATYATTDPQEWPSHPYEWEHWARSTGRWPS